MKNIQSNRFTALDASTAMLLMGKVCSGAAHGTVYWHHTTCTRHDAPTTFRVTPCQIPMETVMKVAYRGYDITVTREKCLGGWDMLYTSIFRISDGLECLCLCESSREKLSAQILYMEKLIDDELDKEFPWEDYL